MRRRTFIAGLGSAAAWPLAARAQQGGRVRRIGVLMNGTAVEATSQAELAAFEQGLRQLGWIDGQNARIEVRWSGPDPTLQRIYAAQLIGLMPDVILVASTPNLTVIREATSTVPVVFVRVSDPVAQGFVADLRQPGGNLTGFSATNSRSAANGLACSRKSRPPCRGLQSCSIPIIPLNSNSSSRQWRLRPLPSACR
jgi:putative ABC transport system substrate-binding protein